MKATRRPDRLTILDLALMVAGAALGLWLISADLAQGPGFEEKASVFVVFLLGGVSIVGPPLLLWRKRRGGRRLGPGGVLWFAQGTASWLLWPPIVIKRAQGASGGNSTAMVCYYYGTPLMALFVTISLISGGWVGHRRRRRASGREAFGLLLGLAWACTGLYILSLIYRKDLR